MFEASLSNSCVSRVAQNYNRPNFWLLAALAVSIGVAAVHSKSFAAGDRDSSTVRSETVLVCPDGYRPVRVTSDTGTPILLKDAVIEWPATSGGQTCEKVRS